MKNLNQNGKLILESVNMKKSITDNSESESLNKLSDQLSLIDINITNEKQAEYYGQKTGRYYTFEKNINEKFSVSECKLITTELIKILNRHIRKDEKVLIVGIGNESMHSDNFALKVLDKIFPTDRAKCFKPGVQADTGLDSIEMIEAVFKKFAFDKMIMIDSAASVSYEKIGKCVQVSTNAIFPGSGIKNVKENKNFEAISIIVPTLINIKKLLSNFLKHTPEKYRGGYGEEVLNNHYISPVEINSLTNICAEVVAGAINKHFNSSKYLH